MDCTLWRIPMCTPRVAFTDVVSSDLETGEGVGYTLAYLSYTLTYKDRKNKTSYHFTKYFQCSWRYLLSTVHSNHALDIRVGQRPFSRCHFFFFCRHNVYQINTGGVTIFDWQSPLAQLETYSGKQTRSARFTGQKSVIVWMPAEKFILCEVSHT